MSIKRSLQSSILLLAVIPVILIITVIYITVTNRYAAITQDNATQMASDYSCFFSSHLHSQIIETTVLSNNNDIKMFLLEKINSPDNLLTSSDYYPDIYESIRQLSQSFDHNVNYYLYDIDGYLVTTSDPQSSADWTEVMKEPLNTSSARTNPVVLF